MEKVELPEIEQLTLPSHHQIGDYVHVVVSKAASEADEESILYHGKVIKVHFGPGKVTYDLEFTVTVDTKNKKRYVTRIHNIDGALCCSIKEYEDSKNEEKMPEDSPFDHGGWYNSNEIIFPVNEDLISGDKLIDIDGNRKTFRVGWYDSDERQWHYYHEENDQPIDQKNMKWTELPLSW